VQRLAEFNVVENTYLSIFLALGGMGLILGSIGMGIVVLRNIMERRGELALLRAVGFTRRSLRGMALFEHVLLLVAGLLCGSVAAGVAVLPALLTRTANVSLGSLALVMAGVAVNGLVWTILAVILATRGDLLSALRNE
jgi:ABC-type antimicrobial peptide transport system permease subunit